MAQKNVWALFGISVLFEWLRRKTGKQVPVQPEDVLTPREKVEEAVSDPETRQAVAGGLLDLLERIFGK